MNGDRSDDGKRIDRGEDGTEVIDPATVEVIRNYLSSAANEMQRTLIRTAYNPVIYEMIDFGISLYDADLNLIADSPGLSLFLGANDYGIRKGVEYLGEENLDEGDIVMLNYPYWSSAHTLDVCLFAPVHHDGELVGYAVIRAHWLGIGQKDDGYVLDSTSVHQEGILFPGTKVYKRGEPDEEILDLIRFNVRGPNKVIGDLNAQIAAINVGKRRLQELYDRYDAETIEQATDRILEHGRQVARDGVRELPDGTWSATDYIDNDGITDELVELAVEVTVDGEEFTVDFSDSADETDGPVNTQYGSAETVGKVVLKALTSPEEQSNGGHYDPLTVVAPEGNLFHATYPAPTFIGWPSLVAIDMVFGALAEGMPERVPASSGGDLCSVAIYGTDPETGHIFLNASNEGCGWGAMHDQDGENALMHISESAIRNTPVEVFEATSPVLFERYHLRQDSAGPGRYRGGLGVRRDYRLREDADLFTTIKKTRAEGWGVRGGGPGARNVVVLDDLEEDWEERVTLYVDNDDLYPDGDRSDRKYTGLFRGRLRAGELVSDRTGGGGGVGDPHQRPPEAVRQDVLDGYVSP
ncbi:MAG: hydantoinase B/oxoprolinase family protein, partial [Haloferacaceae archaeon]